METPKIIKNVFAAIKRRWKLSLVVLIVLGIIGGIFYRRATAKEKIETVTVSRQDIKQTLELSGSVDAGEKVDLHFQTAGKLNWVGVKEGDSVKKWHVIATQDVRSVEKNIKQDLITFEQEVRDTDQARKNWEADRRNTVLDLLKNAQGNLDSAVLDVEIKNLSLELSKLISPITGIVTHIDTPIAGVNITPTNTFQIVNPDTLYFSAEVDEADISKVVVNQAATITLDAYSDQPINSSVSWIDFATSTSDGGGTVVLVKLTLPHQDALFYRLGLNGDVTITIDEKKDVLALPFEAIQDDDEGTFVTVKDGKETKRIAITTGIESDDAVEITSGLTEGAEVVIPNN